MTISTVFSLIINYDHPLVLPVSVTKIFRIVNNCKCYLSTLLYNEHSLELSENIMIIILLIIIIIIAKAIQNLTFLFIIIMSTASTDLPDLLSPLWSIARGRSKRLHPVSAQSYCI